MSGLFRWLRRHRRKFYFLGVVSVGAVAAWHLLLPRVRRLMGGEEDSVNMEVVHLARQQQHQEKTLKNCDNTAASLLPRLRQRLSALIDTEALLAELRLPGTKGRVSLWQDLKIRVITRTLVTLYSSCLLTELVHIQLSILGGYIFSLACRSRPSDDKELSDEVKLAFLCCWKHILDVDIVHLIERIEAISKRVIEPIPLQEAVSLRRLDSLLHEIRLAFEGELEACIRVRVMSSLPIDGVERSQLSIVDEAVLARLVREAQELIDCSDFMGVYKACLDSAFSSLLDHLAEEYHKFGNGESSVQYLSIYDVRIPFAKVVPLVDNVATVIMSGDVNSQFNRDLFSTDVLKAFSRNIYDTFSGTESET